MGRGLGGVLATAQVACAACGAMRRVTEERGEGVVTALPGPLRTSRTVVLRDVAGEDVRVEVWAAEDDWRPVGPYPAGIAAVARLPCSPCGRVAGMLTLDGFRLPFQAAMAGGWEECPVFRGPMECIAVSDAI